MNRIGEALLSALSDRGVDASRCDLGALTPSEWHDVAALALQQRVGPLLYWRKPPCPDDVRATLRARATQVSWRALKHQAAYRQIHAAAAPLGISLMALKGMHLATRVYASAGLREMNDIDVMVRPDQVEALSGVVRELGYMPVREVPVPVALAARHHLPTFVRDGVALEVHWRLAPPGSVPQAEPEELWALTTSSPTEVSLVPEAVLVHVCAHAAMHHLEQGLRPLCDLQAIITRATGTLSWPLVLELTHRWHCERSVTLLLSLTRATLGVEVPVEVMKDLAAHRPSAQLLDVAITHTLGDASELGRSVAAGELLATPGFWSKVRHVRDHVWLAAPMMVFLYPTMGTGPFARAVVMVHRIFGLLQRHGRALLGLATRSHTQARSALNRRNALAAWIRHQ